MPPKIYDQLTHEEVTRAELMSHQIMLAIILHHALAGHPNPDGVCREFESATAQIVAGIDLEAIDPERQQAYRDLVVERASVVLDMSQSITRGEPQKPN